MLSNLSFHVLVSEESPLQSIPRFPPCISNSPFSPPSLPDRIKTWNKEKEVYRRLKEVPDKALAASGYSDVNLAKLFQAFSSLK